MKKNFLIFILFLNLLIAVSCYCETQVLNGALKGSISGNIYIDNNSTKASGNISGDWSASIMEDGTITGNANGYFGIIDENGNGFSGTFQVNYDPVSRKLTGIWSLPGLKDNNTINFTIDEFTGKFSGPIKGTIPTKDGGASFVGDIYLDFAGFPTELSGDVNANLKIKVGWEPVSTDGLSSNCSGSFVTDDNGKVKGNWEVNILDDQSITGNANGIFSGVATLNFNLKDSCLFPQMSSLISLANNYIGDFLSNISIQFPYYGTWLGTLQGSLDNGIFFGGSWTESYDSSFYESFGEGFENIDIKSFLPENNDSTFGGSLKINIDVANANSFSIPITGEIKGGGIVKVNIRELAEEQGICEKYSSVLSMFSGFTIPTITLPSCVENGNICPCLPQEVTVKWWLEESSLSGNLGVGN